MTERLHYINKEEVNKVKEESEVSTVSTIFPFICHEVMGLDAMILVI